MRRGATSSRAEVRIRPARSDERKALIELQRRASLALGEHREQLEQHPGAIDLPAEQLALGQVQVAEDDGRLLGFSAVIARENSAELDGLFVDPDCWRRGIGRALVDQATHQARRKGLTLAVTASLGARKFYEKCGFTIEGEAQTRFGPALRMSR
jgi:N-acetylglutamate synthase-like GNAT family acetyltransferase